MTVTSAEKFRIEQFEQGTVPNTAEFPHRTALRAETPLAPPPRFTGGLLLPPLLLFLYLGV